MVPEHSFVGATHLSVFRLCCSKNAGQLVCDLFNDAVSSSVPIASNGGRVNE